MLVWYFNVNKRHFGVKLLMIKIINNGLIKMVTPPSLLAYKLLMFNNVLEKNPQKLSSLLEAAFCPYFLSLPRLCHSVMDLQPYISTVFLATNFTRSYIPRCMFNKHVYIFSNLSRRKCREESQVFHRRRLITLNLFIRLLCPSSRRNLDQNSIN